MRLSLFGKKPSPEEIEREVTEEIEALVRSSDKPPPPSWTLTGGLPVDGPATAGAPVDEVDEVREVEEEEPPATPNRASTKRARGRGRSGTKAASS